MPPKTRSAPTAEEPAQSHDESDSRDDSHDQAQQKQPTFKEHDDDLSIVKTVSCCTARDIDSGTFSIDSLLFSIDHLNKFPKAIAAAKEVAAWQPTDKPTTSKQRFTTLAQLITFSGSSALFCQEQEIRELIPASTRDILVPAWQGLISKYYRSGQSDDLYTAFKNIAHSVRVNQKQVELDLHEALSKLIALYERTPLSTYAIRQELEKYRTAAQRCSVDIWPEASVARIIRDLMEKHKYQLFLALPESQSLDVISSWLLDRQPAMPQLAKARRPFVPLALRTNSTPAVLQLAPNHQRPTLPVVPNLAPNHQRFTSRRRFKPRAHAAAVAACS